MSITKKDMIRGRVSKKRRQEIPIILAFLLPTLIIYTYFFIYPSIQAFYISLNDWNGFTTGMTYIGFDNYRELANDQSWWNAVKISFQFIIVGGILVFAISFYLSGMLSTKIHFRKSMRTIIFFPSVISSVAISLLSSFILNPRFGMLNSILEAIGMSSLIRSWSSPDNLTMSMIAIMAWANSGMFCVILLSAFDGIPDDYVEAAKLDGASELGIFFKIKMPLIKDVIGTSLLIWVINCIKEFGLLYSWGGGISQTKKEITNMAVKMYLTAFGKRVTVFRMGYATAMGVIMFFIAVGLVIIISLIFKRNRYEY